MPPPLPKLAPVIDAADAALEPLKKLADVMQSVGDVVKAVLDPFGQWRDDIMAVADKIGKVLGPALKAIGEEFKAAGGIYAGLFQKAMKAVPDSVKAWAGGVTEAVGKGAGAMGGAMAAVGKGALAAAGAVMEIGSQLANFVRLASPAVFQQWANVMDDVTAIVGQALTPILQIATAIMRAFADALQTLVPIGQAVATALKPLITVFKVIFDAAAYQLQPVLKVVEMLAPAFAALSAALAAIFQAAEPLFNLFIDIIGTALVAAIKPAVSALEQIVPYITAFAMAIKDVTEWVAKSVRELLAMVGVTLEGGARPVAGGSVGAAAKSANIGSVDSAISKAMTSAFSLGSAASTPEGRTAGAAEGLLTEAKALKASLETWFAELPDRLAKALRSVPGAVTDAVRGAAAPVTDAITLRRTREAADRFVRDFFG